MDDYKKITLEEQTNLIKYAKANEILKQLLADNLISKEEFERTDKLTATQTIGLNKAMASQRMEQEELSMINNEYVSLTDIARKYNEQSPSYVIQSWISDNRTIEFLHLWEMENNKDFNEDGYRMLTEAAKSNTITLTAKQWIEKTGAVGLISKQGKSGGTYAHPFIACDFNMWIDPEFRFEVVKCFQLNRRTVVEI